MNPRSLFGEAVRHFEAGRLVQAGAVCQQILDKMPTEPNAEQMLGVIALRTGEPAAAERHFRNVLSVNPGHAGALYELGGILLSQGDFKEAKNAFRQGLKVAPRVPDLHAALGDALKGLGDFQEAERSFRAALKRDRRHFRALNNLGNALMDQSRYSEAAEMFRSALNVEPRMIEAHNNLGNALSELDQIDEAIACFERALELEPGHPGTRANLASLYEETNRLDESRQAAQRALTDAPGHPLASLVYAKIARRTGQYADGIEKAQEALAGKLPTAEQRALSYEIGRLHERNGDIDEAFRWFGVGNDLAAQEWDPRSLEHNQTHARVLAEIGQLTEDGVRGWDSPDTEQSRTPVFLTGFPRSGTTLLDRMLSGHADIRTLEERPFVSGLRNRLEVRDVDIVTTLSNLSQDELTALRQQYKKAVAGNTQLKDGQVLIDRHPFHLTEAVLINRLWPEARFILAVRHPADVVLSCYMQEFRMNDAVANFLDLDTTADFYRDVMNLWVRSVDVLGLNVHTVHYEQLLAEPETEIRAVLEFIDLDWDPGVLDFAEREQKRGRVRTASYDQVAEPLYQRARYRWQRYVEYLQPVLGKLEPFMNQYHNAAEKSE